MICDDPVIQKILPQIIIGNAFRFTAKLMRTVAAEKPGNVEVWRAKSAWNNCQLMCKVLRTLASALRAHTDRYQLMLTLDVAPCHIHPIVSQCAARLGIWLLYIPAKMTYLLQPLDTHCFSSMKMRLKRKFQDARRNSQSGQVSAEDWLRILFGLPAGFLAARPWRNAFAQNGLVHGDIDYRSDVSDLASAVGESCLLAQFPTSDELQKIWPKNKNARTARANLLKSVMDVLLEETGDAEQGSAIIPSSSSSSSSSSSAAPASIALASRLLPRACRRYPARASV